jgi:SAM-dependent methyltransferase
MATCEICSAVMGGDLIPQTFRCPSCGFLASELPITINQSARLDENAREIALRPLREQNYEQFLDECADLLPVGATLLDIGCAHGWFMEAARRRGVQATGVEPDRDIAARARAAGHEVVEGYFPDAVPVGASYDAITFNDVLEHIPAVRATVRTLPSFLEPGGIVIINIPVASGLIFRLCRYAARCGVRDPLARMWQLGLPSPHLSYFSAATLLRLFEDAGFRQMRSGALESISTRGLYERIRSDRSVGPTKAFALYAAARTVRLVASAFPSDIQYFVFQYRGG